MHAQNDAAEIGLRAERRLGELTREMPKSGGGRPSKTGRKDGPVSYADQGIDKRDAAKWQAIAAIPARKLDQLVAASPRTGRSSS